METNNGLNMMKKVIILALLTLISLSCKSNPTAIKAPDPEKWESIPEFQNISIRSIIKLNSTIFVSGVVNNNIGVIYSSNDAQSWKKLREFNRPIGPLTINADSLFCLGDSLYRFIIATNRWETVCKPEPVSQDPGAMGDMVVLNNKLYAMQTEFVDAAATYLINYDGSTENLSVYNNYQYRGGKFIKSKDYEKEIAYVRGQYWWVGFFVFDGVTFNSIQNGLSEMEISWPPTNSMAINGDTLFAGFRYPSRIKYLNNNTWYNYTDTLPYSESTFLLKPTIITEPTAITFFNNRLFCATQSQGVFEWNKNKGWIKISNGLIYDTLVSEGFKDFYRPVVFLENLGQYLLAGYGDPGYAQWGGQGLFKWKLN